MTLTNFYVVTPDSHSDDCALATQVGPAGLAVDGAGNGVLEAGEVAVVSPTWANTGLNVVALNGTASAFGGPVGPPAPTYDLIDASGSYATLNPSQSAACSDCYGVSITAATRPATHWDATLTESLDSATLQQGAPLPTQKIWTLHVGGSFTDVASGNFYPYIETVLHNNVTAGCGDGTTFCPSNPVTRQEMAVFLLKAFESPGYAPPACITPAFVDVPCSSLFGPWINELVARDITAGCGDGTTFCPSDPVTREQMAVLLLKTFEGSGYVPPTCTTADLRRRAMLEPVRPVDLRARRARHHGRLRRRELLRGQSDRPAGDGGLPRQDVWPDSLRSLRIGGLEGPLTFF